MSWKDSLNSALVKSTGHALVKDPVELERRARAETKAKFEARIERLKERHRAEIKAQLAAQRAHLLGRRDLGVVPAGASGEGGGDAQRLRAARRRNKDLKERLDRANAELGLIRDFTLDVFPDVELEPAVTTTCERVVEEHLTYLSPSALRSLAVCVAEAERSGREGLIVEAGTALGGSAIVMAAAKSPERRLVAYDAFGMIPPPSTRDSPREAERYATIAAGDSQGIAGEKYYGYRDDLLSEVTASFERLGVPVPTSNVSLVKGLFADTIDLDEPVALAHLDGDWYESTLTCLQRLAPLLTPGGRIVLDDYYYWSGARTATDEYFAGRRGFRIEHRGRVHVVRTDDA